MPATINILKTNSANAQRERIEALVWGGGGAAESHGEESEQGLSEWRMVICLSIIMSVQSEYAIDRWTELSTPRVQLLHA